MTDQVLRVRVGPSAEQDLRDGFLFYESQAEGLGAYYLDSLMADLHRALSKRFPFAIYYDFDGTTVTVAAVLDCRRDPRSIRKRLTR